MIVPQNLNNQFSSSRAPCDVLGLNRQSKYVKEGRKNRKAYNKFLELDGDMNVGEMGVCREGYGILKEFNEESVTISLLPWECDVMYKPATTARMTRWEPPLDGEAFGRTPKL